MENIDLKLTLWDQEYIESLAIYEHDKVYGVLLWDSQRKLIKKQIEFLIDSSVDYILSELLIEEIDFPLSENELNFINDKLVYVPPHIKSKNVTNQNNKYLLVSTENNKYIKSLEKFDEFDLIFENNIKDNRNTLENIPKYRKVSLLCDNPNLAFAYINNCIENRVPFQIFNKHLYSNRTHILGLGYENLTEPNISFKSKVLLTFKENLETDFVDIDKANSYSNQTNPLWGNLPKVSNLDKDLYSLYRSPDEINLPSYSKIHKVIYLLNHNDLNKNQKNLVFYSFFEDLLEITRSGNTRFIFYFFLKFNSLIELILSDLNKTNSSLIKILGSRVSDPEEVIILENMLLILVQNSLSNKDYKYKKEIIESTIKTLNKICNKRNQIRTETLIIILESLLSKKPFKTEINKYLETKWKPFLYYLNTALNPDSIKSINFEEIDLRTKNLLVNGLFIRLGLYPSEIFFFTKNFDHSVESLKLDLKNVFEKTRDCPPYNLLILLKYELGAKCILESVKHAPITHTLWCILHSIELERENIFANYIKDIELEKLSKSDQILMSLVQTLLALKYNLNNPYYKPEIFESSPNEVLPPHIFAIKSFLQYYQTNCDFDYFDKTTDCQFSNSLGLFINNILN